MALRFIDSGGDHYATANITSKWSTSAGLTVAAGGRFGTNCLTGGAGSQTNNVTKQLDSQPTWFTGHAWKLPSLGSANFLQRFIDGVTTHTELRFNSTNQLFITRAGTTLATSTWTFSANIWYYIECEVTIHDTTGVFNVKVDGDTKISFTGDTRNGGNASADIIQFGTVSGGNIANTMDDFYICDATGSAPTNTFLGDIRVQALFPNGNGNSSQLVGNDGNSTDNYLLVDETTPSTADYVESSTVGDKDTYGYGNLTPTTGTVFGVQILPYAAKTDAGARSIVSVARLSATETDSAAKVLSASANYLPDIRETKPGGGAWSITDVNSAEFGVKVDA